MGDRAVSSTNAVEEQVGRTMFPLRFIEAVVNSVERTRSTLSIGGSRLFADLIEVDNMKVLWLGEKTGTFLNGPIHEFKIDPHFG